MHFFFGPKTPPCGERATIPLPTSEDPATSNAYARLKHLSPDVRRGIDSVLHEKRIRASRFPVHTLRESITNPHYHLTLSRPNAIRILMEAHTERWWIDLAFRAH